MVEVREARYFIAIAEELNFGRAAERLQMSQPPLSAAIKALEKRIGAELLHRTTREVRLTGPGRGRRAPPTDHDLAAASHPVRRGAVRAGARRRQHSHLTLLSNATPRSVSHCTSVSLIA